ncbi:rhamnogalacturonan acetylesterase [Neobacillus vireti]|uniref:rhamnogalacturonan acetylesterase n=1 Tax=Neobacillus vireti TaxID=220686 RepID=UPI0030008758
MEKRVKVKVGSICLLIILLGFAAWTMFNKSGGTPKTALAQQTSKPITIYLAGDSTVSDYPITRFPRTGWGQVLPSMLDQQVTIRNYAKPGRSSKSFIYEGRLNWILKSIHKGDYLFIQFGHNDEKFRYHSLYTNPNTTYKTFLKKYIDGARKKGAIPILVTPVQRMSFTNDGAALETHGDYPIAMKELAKKEHVPVIDLAEESKKLYQRLGPVKTKNLFLWLKAGEYPNYPDGVKDPTHFQKYGARQIARLVIKGIEKENIPLKVHVLPKYRQ